MAVAYARLQWKGTDACMDVYCSCNNQLHVDGFFAHHIKCPYCHRVFECNPYIMLLPRPYEPEGKMLLDKDPYREIA